MATRFYVDQVAVPDISPAFDANWEQTTDMVRRRMVPAFGTSRGNNSGALEVTVGSAETSTSATFDVGLLQLVSPPIAAQTITGTFAGQMRFKQSNLAANMSFTGSLRVFSGDGSTLRGTLKTYSASATQFHTLLRNIKCPASASVTSVTSQDGDVIVFDIAVRAANTDATSYTATCSYGRSSTVDDLAVDETDTTALNPWWEFSQNLLFLPDSPGGIFKKRDKFSLIEQETSGANAALTVTLPAVSGRKHAITFIEIKRAVSTPAITGNDTLFISTLNLQDMNWVVGNAMSAGGTQTDVDMKFTRHPLLSDLVGSPTIIALPAAGANCKWSVRVGYHLVP